jgi:hypothetical protein
VKALNTCYFWGVTLSFLFPSNSQTQMPFFSFFTVLFIYILNRKLRVDPANNAFERSKIILDLVISSNFEFLLADSLSPAGEVKMQLAWLCYPARRLLVTSNPIERAFFKNK